MGNHEHSKEAIHRSIDASLSALGSGIDIFYLHMPDHNTSFAETLEACDQAYRQSKFKRLGLSNQSPTQVEEIISIAEQHGYVKPSVYQGHYNPLTRTAETALLPLLRKHGMSFFGFTPSGAGIFSGQVSKNSTLLPEGRFSHSSPIGQYWSSVYLRDELLSAADHVHAETEKFGISGHNASLRWVLHHSALKQELGDGMIIGFSSLEQLRSNLEACDAGPLPAKLVQVIDGIWPDVQHVAPWAWMDNVPKVISDDIGGKQA